MIIEVDKELFLTLDYEGNETLVVDNNEVPFFILRDQKDDSLNFIGFTYKGASIWK